MTILTILGASGDLVKRKTIPALFYLFVNKKLPENFIILGISRSPLTDQEWSNRLLPFVQDLFGKIDDFSTHWDHFTQLLRYLPGDLKSNEIFLELDQLFLQNQKGSEIHSASPPLSRLHPLEVIYYLALSPDLCPLAIEQLEKHHLCQNSEKIHFRIIMEKPFGRDLLTAESLNDLLHQVFQEEQIFRIDHFLAKETVNNIFVLRFANTIFEPVWNNKYIESIEITANESITVENRGSFYDKTGVLRDMFQNHLLQLLAITAMEPPAIFDSKAVRDEKVKVFQSLRFCPFKEISDHIVLGQYAGYHAEKGVAPRSKTPTFAAVRLFIDNWRWKDVPFFLRSGKGMSCRTTQIVIQFKRPPVLIFKNSEFDIPVADSNRLLIQLQPSEGIRLGFLAKAPGAEMRLKWSELSCSFEKNRFSLDKKYSPKETEAYARLLLDVLSGNSFLFLRNDEIEYAWKIIDPLQKYVESSESPDPMIYELGNWGPPATRPFNHHWYDLCPIIATK